MHTYSEVAPWYRLLPYKHNPRGKVVECKACGRWPTLYVNQYGRYSKTCPSCHKNLKDCPPIEQSIEEPKPMKCNVCVHSDVTEGCKKGLKESYDCIFGEWECSLCLTLVPLAVRACPKCGFCIDC